MKKIRLFSCLIAIFTIFACEKQHEQSTDTTVTEISGSMDFFSSLSCLQDIKTKGGEVNIDEVLPEIQPIFSAAKEYLLLNGYDYSVDFAENDPNIILTAYALMEHDFNSLLPDTKITITETLSCIFLGEAVGGVTAKNVALLAKKYAKKILARAVPYAGTAMAVITAGYCLYENW